MGLFKKLLVIVVCAALAGSAYALVNDQSLIAGNLLPLLPVITIPEPADWTVLLCGLAVAAFIARRKTSQVTG
jgi:hypothetical protein